MNEQTAWKELITAMEARARIGSVCGLDEDVARAEIRYWSITGRWFDNTMAMPFYSKGCALDGFCAHRHAHIVYHLLGIATREDPAEEIDRLECADCGATVGEIGYDVPRGDNRREPELAGRKE